MGKIYGFDPKTRSLYFGAMLAMIVLGVLSLLTAFFMASHHSRHERRNAASLLLVSGVMFLGSVSPLQGWRRGRRSRVVVAHDGLTVEDNGTVRTVAWADIVDLSEMPTYLVIGLRDRGGSLTLPRSYENFPELVEEIRQRARVRDW